MCKGQNLHQILVAYVSLHRSHIIGTIFRHYHIGFYDNVFTSLLHHLQQQLILLLLVPLTLLYFQLNSISPINMVTSSFLQVFSVLFLDTFPFHCDPFSAFYISKDFTGDIDRLLIGISGLSPIMLLGTKESLNENDVPNITRTMEPSCTCWLKKWVY